MADAQSFKHPKVFYMIFMLEIWERFGYATVIAIAVLFFVQGIGLTDSQAFVLFGAYSSLMYGFIVLGGFIGDNILGAKRTIVLGLLVMLVGYLLLGFGDINTVYWAMALICVGTGLFKSNPSSLLAKCYPTDNPQLIHNAFTMFYMAINIGAVLGLFFSPLISKHYGFQTSFVVAAIGMVLALVTFAFSKNSLSHIHTAAGRKALNYRYLAITLISLVVLAYVTELMLKHVLYAQITVWIVSAVVIGAFLKKTSEQVSVQRRRMILALILMAEAIVYKILYVQMQTSINFYAINNVEHSLFGFSITAQSFQSLNPFWIIVMSPVLAYYYMKSKDTRFGFSIYNKFAVGMLLCGLAFISLYFSRFFANDEGVVSAGWLVLSYGLQSTGELLISGLGVAMVAELVPAAMSGFAMGMWFVFLAIGSMLGGHVASLVSTEGEVLQNDKLHTLISYTDVFLVIGICTLVFAMIMFSSTKLKAKLIGQ
jgi:proton-dependent oligopeptide transporter, POT family